MVLPGKTYEVYGMIFSCAFSLCLLQLLLPLFLAQLQSVASLEPISFTGDMYFFAPPPSIFLFKPPHSFVVFKSLYFSIIITGWVYPPVSHWAWYYSFRHLDKLLLY